MPDLLHQKPLLGRQINWAHPLAKGLVGCWVFNEGSGNKVYDIASHKYDLDFNNSPIWSPGKDGYSIFFDDASTEYLQNNTTPISGFPFTMAGWGKSDINNALQTIIGMADKDTTNQYSALWMGAIGDLTKVSARNILGGGVRDAISTIDFSINTWHHLCGVWTATSVAVYLDGGSKGTDNVTGFPALENITVGRMGDNSPAQYMSGKIDLPMIWNRALSDDEVAWLYREPTAMFQQNRVRWFSVGAAPSAAITVLAAAYLNSRRRLKGDWLGF